MFDVAKIAEEMQRMLADLAERDMALAEKIVADAKAAGTPEALIAVAKAYENAARRVRESIKEEVAWARLAEDEARRARAKPAVLPKDQPTVRPKEEQARTAAPSSYPPGLGRTLHDWRNSN